MPGATRAKSASPPSTGMPGMPVGLGKYAPLGQLAGQSSSDGRWPKLPCRTRSGSSVVRAEIR
eukprot:10247447-Alexandrium_andersonii.AAC.1